jgi:L-ascorbate metabolism protein UlaG (beta-lactamase superfamily)
MADAQPPSQCSLTFVGTATMVLRFGPITVLTDPNFLHRGQRAYLGYGLTSVRRTEPALQIADLPELDGIVLSHLHGDHWDRIAHRGLDRDLPVITTPKAARTLHRRGFERAEGLATWTATELRREGHRVSVTALPGRHAPGIAQRLLPPVMGSMLEYQDPGGRTVLRMYISGDTLRVPELDEIPVRCGAFDVAVLHLGGTRLPGGLLVTMDADQGIEVLQLIKAHTTVPIHNDDYGVFKSPLSLFRSEVNRRGLNHLVTYVAPGQTAPLTGH